VCGDETNRGITISERTSKMDSGQEEDELKMQSRAVNEFDPYSSLPRIVSG
jgi:uncharacterized protein YfdQ (DUF2303 family)